MERNTKNMLLIFTGLCIVLIVFFVRFNQQHRDATKTMADAQYASTFISLYPKSMRKGLIEQASIAQKTLKTDPAILRLESVEPTCPNKYNVVPVLSQQRKNYLLAHAVTWYLDGEDKYQIAQTLAASFSHALAKDFMLSVDDLSLLTPDIHSYNKQLKLAVGKSGVFDWNDIDFERQYISTGGSLDSAQQLSADYPDIALDIWLKTLESLIEKGDIESILISLHEIQQIYIDSPFSQPILERFGSRLSFVRWPLSEKQVVIDAMAKLGPVYYDSKINIA